MKLLYATSIIYPSGRANTLQIFAMAKEFHKQLAGEFVLGGRKIDPSASSGQVSSGSDVRVVNMDAARSYVLAWKYLKFIKENKIDAVYCREPRLLFTMSVYNKLFFRIKLKIVYEVHTIFGNSFADPYIERALVPFVDVYVFVTEHLQEFYVRKYGCKGSIKIVAHDAVDLGVFDLDISREEARRKMELPADKKIVGYFGRFKTMGMEKGIGDVLLAMKQLPPDIVFVCVGGRQREVDYYTEEAKKLGISDRVILRDHTTQDRIAIYEKAADVLVMPFPKNQHYSYFMSPLKMFEYMASGRPIVATDLPSVREVLNEDNAVLVKPNDATDIARGILWLFNEPDSADKIAQNAYEIVKNHTWEKRVAGILAKI